MRKRYCCDNMCKQGRYCPNDTYYHEQYQRRYYNLWQWIKGFFK
jgi:hypothetical protein